MWASAGRSTATFERAEEARLEDVGDVRELCRRCEVLISVCPPHAAVEVACSVGDFSGIYVDANAISAETARTIGGLLARFVDGGVIGPPPHKPGTTRLYLSGIEAERLVTLFAGTTIDARVVSTEPGAASALKMSYASCGRGEVSASAVGGRRRLGW
jgi:hypothetical protein